MKNILLKTIGAFINMLSFFAPALGARLGMFFFSYPMRQKMHPKHVEYLQKSVWMKIDHEGITLATYKWGTGKTNILMVHGWQSHSYRWKKYFDQFDLDKFTIYALDAPGHGLTTGNQINVPNFASAINRVIEEIGDVQIVIGHSFGGVNCLYAIHSYNHPSVQKLVMLASPGEITDFIQMFQSMLGINPSVMQNIMQLFKSRYNKSPEDFSAKRMAAQLKIDGLIIHDEDDTDTLPKYAKEMHESWPQSELLITKGLNHKLNQDEIIAKINDFINQPVKETVSM